MQEGLAVLEFHVNPIEVKIIESLASTTRLAN